jgi:hypothetical protein
MKTYFLVHSLIGQIDLSLPVFLATDALSAITDSIPVAAVAAKKPGKELRGQRSGKRRHCHPEVLRRICATCRIGQILRSTSG